MNAKLLNEANALIKQAVRDADASNGEVGVYECIEFQIAQYAEKVRRTTLKQAAEVVKEMVPMPFGKSKKARDGLVAIGTMLFLAHDRILALGKKKA